MDTEKIVGDFTSILDELKFNSRPIITTLTKMAEENISCAQQFVDAVEKRIETCVPKQKLFAFYVLDSICKNAGSPYTIYFRRNLAKLYKRTYLIVDNQTRTDLIKMFKLWMEPSNNSMDEYLFDKESLESIEQFLVKASALHQRSAQAPTVPGLLREIDRLALLTRERIRQNPQDERLNAKIAVLHQLKQELQREEMPPKALQQVQMQLRQIFAQEQQILLQQQKQQPQATPPPHMHDDITRNQEGDQPNIFGGSALSSSFFPNASNILPPSEFTQSQVAGKASKIRSLYDSLEKESLLFKPPKQSVVALEQRLENSTQGSQQVELPPLPLLQDILGDVKSHFATISVDIVNTPNLVLCQQTVMQDNPAVIQLTNLLYRSKPNKCSTCGKRFGNSAEEKKKERDHLDWHFRINKRLKGNVGAGGATSKNIQSRNWYLHDAQWIQFKDEEIVSTTRREDDTITLANVEGPSTGVTPGSSTFDQSFEKKSDSKVVEQELNKKYVVVPESTEDMSFQCPVCMEESSAVYNDDTGEWIWPNCVESQGKYFHATCFNEAVKGSLQETSINQGLQKLKGLIGK
ncbi:LAFE_0H05204g1_1 [Lachancea fermentati]|uniref:LAFE_0H05204g1_1 n=1 Tax=Lachancea fermentati TaxID=4955 RepID=A0A1G4MJL4_LACFM|nr:LAFE_0H05204g1_1 [Lachancea fermentati]